MGIRSVVEVHEMGNRHIFDVHQTCIGSALGCMRRALEGHLTGIRRALARYYTEYCAGVGPFVEVQ